MKTQKTNPKLTVLMLCIGLMVLYLITQWEWTLPAALVVGLAGVSSKYLSAKIDYLWAKLSLFLNRVITHVLLFAIYFLLLLPIALLSRIFSNQDPLNLKNHGYKLQNKHTDKRQDLIPSAVRDCSTNKFQRTSFPKLESHNKAQSNFKDVNKQFDKMSFEKPW